MEAFWLHFEAWRPLGRPNWHHFEPWKTPRATIVASWGDLGDSLGDFGDIFASLVTPGARFGVILEPCWFQKWIPGASRVPKWLLKVIIFRLKTWDEFRSLSRGTFSRKNCCFLGCFFHRLFNENSYIKCRHGTMPYRDFTTICSILEEFPCYGHRPL